MTSWDDETFVAFDLETSGKYPIGAEICEIAAVKWHKNKIVGEYQTLVATKKPMNAEVIAIHGITNEMLIGAPSLDSVLPPFHAFISDAILMAHNASFDVGFLMVEFERLKLPVLKKPVLCTSILSRKVLPESPNHKLQTLIEFFKFHKGTAHRALDDAKACLELGLKCFERAGKKNIAEYVDLQETSIEWMNFSIRSLADDPKYTEMIRALREGTEVQIVYQGGSKPGEARTVRPIGIVRSVLDDFLVAEDKPGEIPKRYFLKRISASRL